MAETIKQPWGESRVLFSGEKKCEDGRVIYLYGENHIKEHDYILMHLHYKDSEEYIPRTHGIKILVMSVEEYNEYKKFSKAVLTNKIKSLKPAEIGKVVYCPMGYMHAVYNDSDEPGLIEFFKYTT